MSNSGSTIHESLSLIIKDVIIAKNEYTNSKNIENVIISLENQKTLFLCLK